MKADKHRKPGFYWVRFEGEPCVAEYVTPTQCAYFGPGNNRAHWHMTGTRQCFLNREVCELLSGKLEILR